MQASDVSSQEKLDQLLHDGKITDEDYLLLSKAMSKAAPPHPLESKADPRPLRKSRSKRWLGGVCAGIADYFRIDPIIVRIIAIILLVMALPVTLAVYLLLYFLLPWDDADAPRADGNGADKKHPWLFAMIGLFLLVLLPNMLGIFLMPRIAQVYSNLGAALPVLARFPFLIAAKLHLFGFPWGILLGLFIVLIATLAYVSCQNRVFRAVYFSVFSLLCAFFALLVLAGCIFAILRLNPYLVHF